MGQFGERREEQSEERTRAQISSRVWTIWARALERPELDEEEDFFIHGGNHFLAPVMIESINQEFAKEMGTKLTVRDLEEARTVAKMTDRIYFELSRIDRSTVVPLRNIHGSSAPLFMVHGVGGNVLGFYSLARCMGEDQPVYGIQAQSLLSSEPAVLRLEQMAAKYVMDMRAVCPAGPYHLLGFSFGGLVAYEIAQQLRAAGLEVGLVGMLDTRQPDWMKGVPARGPLYKRAILRMYAIYRHTHKRKGRLRYLWRRVSERALRASYKYKATTGLGAVASAERNVREINLVAGIAYKVRPYEGKVTLFRAESDPTEQPLPLDLDWGKFARGGLTITPLPGDHGRILHQPGLGALARELKATLREAGPSDVNDALYLGFADPGAARVSMEI
jgi:thioesterase domain-containing protein